MTALRRLETRTVVYLRYTWTFRPIVSTICLSLTVHCSFLNSVPPETPPRPPEHFTESITNRGRTVVSSGVIIRTETDVYDGTDSSEPPVSSRSQTPGPYDTCLSSSINSLRIHPTYKTKGKTTEETTNVP